MRAVVVHHEMHVQLGRQLGGDRAQELHKFAAAVTPMQLADYLARRAVQRREQGSRAVAHAVVGTSLGNAQRERQHGLRAIERLGLAFLIHAAPWPSTADLRNGLLSDWQFCRSDHIVAAIGTRQHKSGLAMPTPA